MSTITVMAITVIVITVIAITVVAIMAVAITVVAMVTPMGATVMLILIIILMPIPILIPILFLSASAGVVGVGAVGAGDTRLLGGGAAAGVGVVGTTQIICAPTALIILTTTAQRVPIIPTDIRVPTTFTTTAMMVNTRLVRRSTRTWRSRPRASPGS